MSDIEQAMVQALEGKFVPYVGRENIHSYDKNDPLQCHYHKIQSKVRMAEMEAEHEAERALNGQVIREARISPQAIQAALNETEWRPKMATFLLGVSQITGVSVIDLKSNRSDHESARARYMFFYLCRHHTPCSLPQIGRFIRRHHATVMHGLKKVSNNIADYPELEKIKTLLGCQ